ncbi:DUF6461 domain-containing protein [Streptomyces sp. NPDC002779]|uniref:DUF6461 domain-containing protein n=1 Tax=Streptomyces sp. NPDC002779 TaxID=3364664 RepID=UPI0036AA67F0
MVRRDPGVRIVRLRRELPPQVSRGTRVVAASLDANAVQRVQYAVDGRVLSSFDPLFPAYDDGQPSRWRSADRRTSA